MAQVAAQVSPAQLEELIAGGEQYLTETHTLDGARVVVSKRGDLSYIEVSGRVDGDVSRHVERVARGCRGNVGLAFKEIRRDPRSGRATKLDARVVSLLRRLKERCESRGHAFVLCSPPPEVTDVLRLVGATEAFTIVAADGEVRHAKPARGTPSTEARATSGDRPARGDEAAASGTQGVERALQVFGGTLEWTAHLHRELESAAQCVQRFLPQSAPRVPGHDIGFTYQSCEAVGGDFFDFFSTADHKLGISIGDVTGHGLNAALIMGITRKLIQVRALDAVGGSPAVVLSKVNEDLRGDLGRKTFVTAIYGELDLRTGIFVFARAGHEHPILFRPGTSALKTVEAPGPALGMMPKRAFDATIQAKSVRLDPGVALLLVTDGIAECRNEREALFSRERLIFELTHGDGATSAQEQLDSLIAKVEKFRNGRAREDDMTAILVRRGGES